MSQAYARTRQVLPTDKTLDPQNGRVYEVPRGSEDWDSDNASGDGSAGVATGKAN